jgi:hypothetical protein
MALGASVKQISGLDSLPDKEYAAMMVPFAQDLAEKRATILEWIQDDVPLEDADGVNLISACQAMYNARDDTYTPTMSHLQKPPKFNTPQCTAGAPPKKENVLVFEDSHGYTQTILANAPEGRIGSRKILQRSAWESYTLDDIKAILGDGKSLNMIMFGASLDAPKSTAVADVIAWQTVVVRLCYYVVKAIVDNELPIPKLCILTRGMFAEEKEIHEQAGLSLVMFATMHGFTNTARQELEDTDVYLIDTEYFLDPPFWQTQDFNLRQRLAAEVWRNQTFGVNIVRVLNSGRYVARNVWATPYADAAGTPFPMPEPGQIISISGGNGALGIVMGGWLLDQAEIQGKSGFEIQFLSRSMKISDNNMANWKMVEEKAEKLGVKAYHKKLDMSSQEVADQFLKETDGKLYGFIHSAGVLVDSMISNMTWDKFETSFNPKHRAAYYLHDALSRFPNKLSFFWMFSSVAVQGNLGQLNYSSSNAALDGLARHRRALGLPGQTMQWGGWGEVGMASTMDDLNKRRLDMGPFPPFSTEFGLLGMEEGLKCNVPTFAVYAQNPNALVPMMLAESPAGAQFMRNFASVICPLPPPSSNSDKCAEHLHRHLGPPQFMNPNREMLLWKNYIKPVIDQEYDSGQALGASVQNLLQKQALTA